MWPDPSNTRLLFILVAKFQSQQADESNDENYEGARVFPDPGSHSAAKQAPYGGALWPKTSDAQITGLVRRVRICL